MSAPLPVTVDDASPLISYKPPKQWTQETSDDGSYSITNHLGASLSIQFAGNWVNVTGWKSIWHGNYTVMLDQSTYTLSGRTNTDDLVRTTLFNATIGEGSHTLTIRNEERDNLQIDSISYACLLGGSNSTNAPLQTTTVEDTDGSFSYYPKGMWDVSPPNPENPKDRPGHSISMLGASVNFTFSGNCDAVSIYGTTGPGHSSYSVSRPGQPAQQFTANRGRNSSDVLLYVGTGFGPGNHTINLTSQNSGLFQISYAEVHSAVGEFATTSSATTPTPTIVPQITQSSHSKLSGGAIAGITIAALVFIFLNLIVWSLLRRNKALWMRLQRGYMVQSQFDIGSPPRNGSIIPLPYNTNGPLPRPAKIIPLPPDDDESFEAGALSRAITMQSTASTLVAQDGSNMNGRFSLKPFRLIPRGTPASSITTIPTHLSRNPSTRHLLREESQWFDSDVPEESEDRIDEVLRYPIRRNEPSQDRGGNWQSHIP